MFRDKITGTMADRPQLAKLMKALAPGDVVTTPRRRASNSAASRPSPRTMEENNDVPFILYPFMKEWGCLDHAEVERGVSVMEQLGIEVPGVTPESPPEQT